MTTHNDYLFQIENDEFLFLRQFDEMYHNCQDPHGQSKVLTRLDYQFVGQLTRRLAELLYQGESTHRLKILDIGCGLGTFTRYLQELFADAEVSGCDISDTALQKARISTPDCDFFTLDLKVCPSGERTFDLLIALHVLCYFTEDEIRNVIRHFGILMNP
jgi:trans-aconitate methyltransferase